ncbi:MAG: FAD-dependent oxidoreductase [Deltaproteobacteria bacterium]|nr:FAD-dependent oxidoreductase [Deltaproteobacteria bacterium]
MTSLTKIPSAEPSMDLVVLGGGPAGLAAAWEAAHCGMRVMVVEREAVLGGLCATIERDGFRFDLGGHRIVSKRASLVTRIRELMGDALEERTRESVIALDGQRFAYPLVASELVQKLSPVVLARALADYGAERVRDRWDPSRGERDFRAWVTQRFGRTLYDLFFGPYTEKLWGLPATELSSDWAAQRISLLNLADVGLRLLGARKGGARTYARRYLYPTGGIGVLFERLVARLRAQGVQFVTHAEVCGFTRDLSGRVTAVQLSDGAHGRREVRTGAVVSTAALGQCAQWVRPDDLQIRRDYKSLRHRGLRFLNVMLDGPGPVLGATWMYVSDPSLIMTRVQEPAARSPSMTPRGCASLMLEIPADPGDAHWNASDPALAQRALGDLVRLGIDVRGRVRGVFSSRTAQAYPVYRVGYHTARDALLQVCSEPANLWTLGRQGLFRYVFMDTAMEMGFAAVRAIAKGAQSDPGVMLAIDNNPTVHEVQNVLG